MLSGQFTQIVIRGLDRVIARTSAKDAQNTPARQRTGWRGEEDAYFHLRRRGYIMVARNFRTPRHHGEIDLIGWDKDVLCFIEVKTRTTRDIKLAAAAVDRKKRHHIRVVIRDYLRTFPELPHRHFGVVTVYYEGRKHPTFELFQNACSRRKMDLPRVAAGWRKRLLARTQKRPHCRPLGHYFDRPRQASHRFHPRLCKAQGRLLSLLLRK